MSRIKTYYVILSAGHSAFARYRGAAPIVITRRPSTCDLGTADQVWALKASSVGAARNLVGLNRTDLPRIGAKFLFSV